MPHSIFIRDITDAGGQNFQMIAYEISSSEDARTLICGVAESYPEHGYEDATQVSWFRDKNGLHEIWAWPAIDVSN